MAATSGFVTAPFIVIILISAFLRNFADIPLVQHAFAGIRVCVCVLILQAILKLWNNSVVDKRSLFIYFMILSLRLFSKYLPVAVPVSILVIFAGVCGLVFAKDPSNEKTEVKK